MYEESSSYFDGKSQATELVLSYPCSGWLVLQLMQHLFCCYHFPPGWVSSGALLFQPDVANGHRNVGRELATADRALPDSHIIISIK